ncbi:hypothetical protein IAI18_01245 [Acetobacteraceae bacterium H6797]|nr:hypothetical protein [Acetobacteraceae bacterium H6797]
MKFAYATAFAVSFGALAVATTPASAFEIPEAGLTVTATPAVASDYLFRGISQTRSRPALQLTLDVEHESGFYVGAFGSNVAFAGTNARQEVDGLFGYRFGFAGLKFDIGAIYYGYPGYDKPTGGAELAYWEFGAKVAYEVPSTPVKLLASYFYSPDFSGETGTGHYGEVGADISLPYAFTLSGRAGYQWIADKVDGKSLSYGNWSVSVSRELVAGLTLSVGYYDTDIKRSDPYNYKYVNPRAMVMLSRAF